jgi:hypothetical protein
LQVGHLPVAFEIGQGGSGGVDGDGADVAAVDRIAAQQDFADFAAAAVPAPVAAAADLGDVAAGLVAGAGVQADGADFFGGQALQLGGLAEAVAVAVLPDEQALEVGVGAVDLAVAVAVEGGQLFETAAGGTAEQFADVVDLAVAVVVEGQEAVVAVEPGGAVGELVAVEVEVGPAGVQVDVFEAVAVQIEDQGIAAARALPLWA